MYILVQTGDSVQMDVVTQQFDIRKTVISISPIVSRNAVSPAKNLTLQKMECQNYV